MARFSSDANLLRVNILQICGITTFQMKVLPVCSGLQNYVQGNGIISCMFKFAVKCTIASSSFNAHSNGELYTFYPSIARVWGAVAAVKFLHSNCLSQFIIIVFH